METLFRWLGGESHIGEIQFIGGMWCDARSGDLAKPDQAGLLGQLNERGGGATKCISWGLTLRVKKCGRGRNRRDPTGTAPPHVIPALFAAV